MSGTTSTFRVNIADLATLSSAASVVLLARRGAGELVAVDPAAVGTPGGGGAGTDGSTVLSGNGAPAASLGDNGDFYIDTGSSLRLFYGPKVNGVWGTGIALKGDPGVSGGNAILHGSGTPSSGIGNNGDFFLDTASANYVMYGPKSAGVWPTPGFALKGPQGTGDGSGPPGPQGDPGPAGVDGKSIITGNGTPSNALGNNGDLFLDLASPALILYGPKAGGVWPATTRGLAGPQGLKGDRGDVGPQPPLSNTSGLPDTGSGSAGTGTTASRADHTHPFPQPVDIGAAPSSHSHSISTIAGLQGALDAKAGLGHTHAIADVSGLQTALNGKQSTAEKGVANGYAGLGADGKVPSAQLPASTGGSGSTANLDNGTADGQVAVWNQALGKYVAETQISIVADRDPVVERNTTTALTFAAHHRRILVLSGNAPLTLAASEVGSTPFQGFTVLIENEHTAQNTITFGAGIAVNQPTAGTGTGGAVKIPVGGQLSVVVFPKGATLIAKCRGDVA